MEQRYLVSVIVSDKSALQMLNEYGLDLFPHTARKMGNKKFAIDGLLTMAEVGKLVENGYRVEVKDSASKMTMQALQVIEFDDWLKMIEKEE